MAGEFIQVLPEVRHKGIVAAGVASVVDLRVPLALAGCGVPVLESQVVLSWGRWRIQAVGH